MRLDKLLELWGTADEVKTNFSQDMQKRYKDYIDDPDHETVGRGISAYVRRKNDPHHLDYVTRMSDTYDRDGTYYYLKAIYEKKIQSPYFPRVYVTNTREGVDEYNIERLYPITTDKIIKNRPFISSYLERVFDVGDDIKFTNPELIANAPRFLAEAIRAGIQGNPYNIKDPVLKKACEQIMQLQESLMSDRSNRDTPRRIQVDMHPGNIMWRITGNMPHLVITDPLY